MQQHIIKKQMMDVRVYQKHDVFALQQKVKNFYTSRVMPILEDIFDELCGEERTLRIEKIEVDLGTFSLKDMDQVDNDRKIRDCIFEAFRKVVWAETPDESGERKSVMSGNFDQWIYYMRHGYLAWNTLRPDEGWHLSVLQTLATDTLAINLLRNVILNDPVSLKRIASQHTDHFLRNLAETLTARSQEELPALLGALLTAVQKPEKTGIQMATKSDLWKRCLQIAATTPRADSLDIIRVLAIEIISDGGAAVRREIQVFLRKYNILTGDKSKIYPKPGGDDKVPNELSLHPPLSDALIKENMNPESEKTEKNERQQNPDDSGTQYDATEIGDDGIYVTHAGIVLLHPFLPTFFNRLVLLADGNFSGPSAREKALYLLHYLATGGVQPFEHELVVAKVLCGFALGEPVSNAVILKESEIEEADDLLKEVIARWNILQNTSLNGLREGFLQRNGKLFAKNTTWYLTVEQSAIDVLLDHLPWNLSMVKLPWMDDFLRVEWR